MHPRAVCFRHSYAHVRSGYSAEFAYSRPHGSTMVAPACIATLRATKKRPALAERVGACVRNEGYLSNRG